MNIYGIKVGYGYVDYNFGDGVVGLHVLELPITDTVNYKLLKWYMMERPNVVIFVFDLSSTSSYLTVVQWIDRIRDFLPRGTKYLLVGNKMDTKRSISIREIIDFSTMFNLEYIETNALTEEGVALLLDSIIEC
jgi:GTPase SAR1 family protein